MNEQNRNLLFAILLSIGILGLWEYMYAAPQREKAQQIAEQQRIERGVENPTQNVPGTPPGPAGSAGMPPTPAVVANPNATRDQAIAATQRVAIDTPRLRG